VEPLNDFSKLSGEQAQSDSRHWCGWVGFMLQRPLKNALLVIGLGLAAGVVPNIAVAA
jgi:hypothetical protein